MVLVDGFVLISISGALLYTLLFAARLNGDPRGIDTHICKSYFLFSFSNKPETKIGEGVACI